MGSSLVGLKRKRCDPDEHTSLATDSKEAMQTALASAKFQALLDNSMYVDAIHFSTQEGKGRIDCSRNYGRPKNAKPIVLSAVCAYDDVDHKIANTVVKIVAEAGGVTREALLVPFNHDVRNLDDTIDPTILNSICLGAEVVSTTKSSEIGRLLKLKLLPEDWSIPEGAPAKSPFPFRYVMNMSGTRPFIGKLHDNNCASMFALASDHTIALFEANSAVDDGESYLVIAIACGLYKTTHNMLERYHVVDLYARDDDGCVVDFQASIKKARKEWVDDPEMRIEIAKSDMIVLPQVAAARECKKLHYHNKLPMTIAVAIRNDSFPDDLCTIIADYIIVDERSIPQPIFSAAAAAVAATLFTSTAPAVDTAATVLAIRWEAHMRLCKDDASFFATLKVMCHGEKANDVLDFTFKKEILTQHTSLRPKSPPLLGLCILLTLTWFAWIFSSILKLL